jgi:hypothetical protein
MEGKYRQPYPRIDCAFITVNGEHPDLGIATGQLTIEVDGKRYSGESMILLKEVKP